MRTLMFLFLVLAAPAAALMAADAAPVSTTSAVAVSAAAATPAATPAAATPGPAITVTLKDGQIAQLNLVRYDHFFLTAVNAVGTSFDIPWTEVRDVEGPDAGADLALMHGNITDEPVPVNSVIQPRRPGTAVARALWPGFILHGSGYRYAGNPDVFEDLAGAELFGVVVGAFGAYLQYFPDTSDTSKTVPQSLTAAGLVIFGATWLWDIGFSPSAARQLNTSKGLALEPLQPGPVQGAQLTYRF